MTVLADCDALFLADCDALLLADCDAQGSYAWTETTKVSDNEEV